MKILCAYCLGQAKLICEGCNEFMCEDHGTTHLKSCMVRKIRDIENADILKFYSIKVYNRIEKIDKVARNIVVRSGELIKHIQILCERSVGKLKKQIKEHITALEKGQMRVLENLVFKEVGTPDTKEIESFYDNEFVYEQKNVSLSPEEAMKWVKNEHKWFMQNNNCKCIAITHDYKYAIYDSLNEIKVCNLLEKHQEAPLQGHTHWVYTVVITHDDKYVVSGDYGGEIRVWDLQKKSLEAVLQGHSDIVTVVAITHSDKHIVSGSNDKTIKVWNFQEKSQEALLEGHTDAVISIAITHDNKYIFSKDIIGKILVWNFQEKYMQECLSANNTPSSWAETYPQISLLYQTYN